MPTKYSRWFLLSQSINVFSKFVAAVAHLTSTSPTPTPGGSMFLFDWKVQQDFCKDGHHWRKKKDGETVNETNEKMKVKGLCEKAKDILVQESNVQF
ncbi:calmodulin-binding transcription activator 1-like [Solanum tuberosum]|uniref:calmodulin-binding transcription activator 1-like n=1 Tax=Solanum tuberosum TaxID=4113 RepID=UPI00073A210E|nr:PREDICTED: calmodulin-binding transcription activator 1-like [Solanum tuberosum]XP_015158409.1 PREDICTED: calmodulin-binding transcription activator 1-like [Solanum tuberosum]